MEPIIYKGTSYQGNALTVDQAEQIFDSNKGNGRGLNRALVAASFSLPENSVGTLDWALYAKLIDAALDLNGLRPKGESTAATEA